MLTKLENDVTISLKGCEKIPVNLNQSFKSKDNIDIFRYLKTKKEFLSRDTH